MSVTNSALAQQIVDLIEALNQRDHQLRDWIGGTATGGPNGDGRYPLIDALRRETLTPSPARLTDMVDGPAATSEAARDIALSASVAAQTASTLTNDNRILSDAARGAAIDARNLAQEHRNHAGTHEANARYWAELAQGSGQGSAEDRTIVEQLAEQVAGDAASALASELSAAQSAVLAATFDPALFDRKADLLSADRITGVLSVDRIPVLPSQRQFASSGGLANLSTAQQNEIGQGSIVTTTDGFRYVYTGTGSKTLASSYVVLADTTPEWSSISGRPSEFTPAAHTQDWSTITGKPTTFAPAAHSQDWSTVTGKPALWDSTNFNPANYFRLDQLNVITGGRTGSEGGEIKLARPESSTNLAGDISIDINGDSLRIFEGGGAFRGVVINLAAQGSQSTIWTSASFDPASKADVAGDNTFTANQTFRGLIPLRVQQSASTGAGFVDLAGVSANSSGAVVFRDNAGARLGYLGNANATTLNIVADVANIALNRRPTFGGNLAWDAGNFKFSQAAPTGGADGDVWIVW